MCSITYNVKYVPCENCEENCFWCTYSICWSWVDQHKGGAFTRKRNNKQPRTGRETLLWNPIAELRKREDGLEPKADAKGRGGLKTCRAHCRLVTEAAAQKKTSAAAVIDRTGPGERQKSRFVTFMSRFQKKSSFFCHDLASIYVDFFGAFKIAIRDNYNDAWKCHDFLSRFMACSLLVRNDTFSISYFSVLREVLGFSLVEIPNVSVR